MGEEEKKAEETEAAAGEKKEEEKKEKEEDAPQEIVLKVDMHCEACARKVVRSLKGFRGVDEVTVDSKSSKVVVKGKSADPVKVSERIQKKSGRKVEIISPLPKPPEEAKSDPPPPPEKKEEPPAVITVVLKVQMHCEACAQVLQKRLRKIKGVESVSTDLGNNEVTVKGVVDPEQLVNDTYKRTHKKAIVVKNEPEKKEEEKKEEAEPKKDEGAKPDEENKPEEGGAKQEEDEEKKIKVKKSEYSTPTNYIEYYASYPPQIFSDENPNACCLM